MTLSRIGHRVTGSDIPEIEEVRVGFIPLTDCASVVVAARLGFDRRYGIRINLSRQLSWAALRDRLIDGDLHAAHMLYGLAYGIELGIGGPRRPMAVLMTLNQNGQAITLSQKLRAAGITTGDALRTMIEAQPNPLRFAHTFATGTHAMWLYYWLAAHGIDPLRAVHTRTVPPPQMVSHLVGDRIDGYSAGEPWNALAVAMGIGFTMTTSQAIWPDHPEKVLASTREFVRQYPNTARALLMSVLDASRYIDEHADPHEIARLLADPTCVDTALDTISERLKGNYLDGLGKAWRDAHRLRFHADGEVNYPYLSDAMWFMSQQRRWGMLEHAPDYHAVAAAVNQTALYCEAASALGIEVPHSPYRTSRLLDGRVWDGRDPESFATTGAFAFQTATRAALA